MNNSNQCTSLNKEYSILKVKKSSPDLCTCIISNSDLVCTNSQYSIFTVTNHVLATPNVLYSIIFLVLLPSIYLRMCYFQDQTTRNPWSIIEDGAFCRLVHDIMAAATSCAVGSGADWSELLHVRRWGVYMWLCQHGNSRSSYWLFWVFFRAPASGNHR